MSANGAATGVTRWRAPSQPINDRLAVDSRLVAALARRDPNSSLVFHRNGIPIRRWRTAWRTAWQAAGVPTRCLHECRRTAARTLIRASGPERGAMRLTGHTSRTIFDRDPIIHEQERLKAEDALVASLARQAQAPRTDNPCDGVAGEGALRWRSFGFVLG